MDLNAILLRMERTLALLHELQGGTPEGAAWAWDGLVQDAAWDSSHQGWSCHRAQAYAQAASARLAAMRDVLWDPTSGCWRDYRLDLEQAAGGSNAAQFSPVWAGALDEETEEQARAVLGALRGSGLVGRAGVLTTLQESGQQWDAPNGWPPLQWLTVMGLRRLGQGGNEGAGGVQEEAQEEALRIAKVRSCLELRLTHPDPDLTPGPEPEVEPEPKPDPRPGRIVTWLRGGNQGLCMRSTTPGCQVKGGGEGSMSPRWALGGLTGWL